MDTTNFILDFTKLVTRYTTTKTPNKNAELADLSNAPLTPEVIIELVQESFSTIFSTPILPSITMDFYKTPTTDMVAKPPNVPNAPTVTRASPNGHSNEIISEQYTNSIAEETEMSGEKQDSSSSKMHLSVMGRSETFSREDDNPISTDIRKSLADAEGPKKINVVVHEKSEKMLDGILKMKLYALRTCAADIITKIDEIERPLAMEATKPIRRLSAIGVYPSTTRNSTMIRSNQPLKMRRSLTTTANTTTASTTPTSSRLNNAVVLGDNLSKRKSVSTTSLRIPSTTTATVTSTLLSPASVIRSDTSMSLPAPKKSPLNCNKIPKNPKYAHIQSSIPKPSATPRNKNKNK